MKTTHCLVPLETVVKIKIYLEHHFNGEFVSNDERKEMWTFMESTFMTVEVMNLDDQPMEPSDS